MARHSAYLLAEQLRAERIDVALAIGNAPLSAFLADQLPTIHISDATAPLMREYYAEFHPPAKGIGKDGVPTGSPFRLAIASVPVFDGVGRPVGYPRLWCQSFSHSRHSLGREYRCRANLLSGGARAIECLPSCFHRRHWERKGGALAVDTAKHFAAAGRPVKLHIIGANPELRQAIQVDHRARLY